MGDKYKDCRRRFFERTGCLITADGSDDHKIVPEGLPNYKVPPPALYDLPQRMLQISNELTGETDEPSELTPIIEDGHIPAEDNVDEDVLLEDNETHRDYDDERCGLKVRGHYGNGWFDGVIQYYNTQLKEYTILFSDNSVDYVTLEDFGGDLFFIQD